MASYRDIYTREIEGLFSNLKKSKFTEMPNAADEHVGQPATFVPFSFNGSDVFDENDTMDVLIYIPDEMVKIAKARAVLAFREFFAPATSASSGGGSTSGSSSTSTSSSGGSSSPTSTDGGDHSHRMFALQGVLGVANNTSYFSKTASGGTMSHSLHTTSAEDIYTHDSSGDHTHTIDVPSHTHDIAHTHSTPDHDHDLEYGVFKEGMPASWSVELRVYEWDGSAWDLTGSITSGLTDEVEDVDLSDYIDGPGKYRIELKSAASQPNDGRLGCDVAGHIVGAIQALQP